MGIFSGCSRCSMHIQQLLRSTDVIINRSMRLVLRLLIFLFGIFSVLYFPCTFKINKLICFAVSVEQLIVYCLEWSFKPERSWSANLKKIWSQSRAVV